MRGVSFVNKVTANIKSMGDDRIDYYESSISQWCEENNISQGKYYYWLRVILGKYK